MPSVLTCWMSRTKWSCACRVLRRAVVEVGVGGGGRAERLRRWWSWGGVRGGSCGWGVVVGVLEGEAEVVVEGGRRVRMDQVGLESRA